MFFTYDFSRPIEYVFVEISAATKKSLTFQQSLNFNLGGRLQSVDQKGVLAILAKAANEAERATQFLEAGKQSGKPQEMSQEEFEAAVEEAESAANKARKLFEEITKIKGSVEALYGKHIPLRVYFKIDNHEIVLAESKEN